MSAAPRGGTAGNAKRAAVADRVLNWLVCLACSVQVLCFVLHVRERRGLGKQPAGLAPQAPPLSAAEEALIALFANDDERAFARETLQLRARGPTSPVEEKKKAGQHHNQREDEEEDLAPPPQQYGPSVVIDGLSQCASFRATTSAFRRVAVAGLFNSGTNLAMQLVRRNCQFENACPAGLGPAKLRDMMARRECLGYPFQVPWGKHNPESRRRRPEVVPSLAHFNRSEILPVVVVKDPLLWMQSMCRVPYSASFRRSPNCCPSPLAPPSSEEEVRVTYANASRFRYESLLDLWNTWNADYWDSPQPRLVVRYEDLLFRGNDTLSAICHCVGGTTADLWDPVREPAKGPRGHGGLVTDRPAALRKYTDPHTRLANLDAHDLAFYNRTVHHGLAAAFHYHLPPSSFVEQAAGCASSSSSSSSSSEHHHHHRIPPDDAVVGVVSTSSSAANNAASS